MNREAAFWALVQSDRVSAHTRAVLQERAAPAAPGYEPALPPDLFRTLRAVLDRVLPQSAIDLAQLVAQAMGTGDGWRFADLPPDAEAYRAGLAAIDEAAGGFAALDDAAQDALLTEVAAGHVSTPGGLDATALQRWFEDLRSDAVKIYTAHPTIFARIGYSGFAYGGDGPRKQGFHDLGAREPWEPVGDVAP